MGFVSTLLGILGFGIGIPVGVLLGFFLFIYSEPKDVEDPKIKPFSELDTSALPDLLPEIPLWIKSPDYECVDWFNKFVADMWPYLDKAICARIRSMAEPIMAEYIGKYQIKAINFEKLSLGTLPPCIHGLKVCETNENQLVIEPIFKWAGNPNIVLSLRFLSLRITIQLVDFQLFAAPRITLKPLVPTFPCFGHIVVSLMEKPHVDFGMKVLGADIMSIPGLYIFVQESIKKQIAMLYLWPQTLHIPILEPSALCVKKPVGILHVNVIRALKLLKKDLLGMSDPYVKLSLTGDKFPARKSTVKKKTLNPEWNEKFKLVVKEPQTQVLQLQVYDWDKVGGHDRLGVQSVPLKLLTPYETKEFTLDLLKDTNVSDKKQRGQLMVEMTFVPFKEDSSKFISHLEGYSKKKSQISRSRDDHGVEGTGVLSVLIHGAKDVEGEHHNNPYALILFRGERKRTKMMRRTRDPHWNEEFEFTLEEPPRHDKLHVEVISKWTKIKALSKVFSFLKESLGYVEINLADVVHNGRINHRYHLINSKNGKLHIEIGWKMI